LGQIETLLNYFMLILGPCALIYGIFSTIQTGAFIRRSVEVDGEVVRLERSQNRGRYGYTYAPIFTFNTIEGVAYNVTSGVGSSPAGFSKGDSVLVRYDPANPEDARIHSLFQTWGSSALSGIVGLAFIYFAGKAFGFLHFL
jgi:hypothetical protein